MSQSTKTIRGFAFGLAALLGLLVLPTAAQANHLEFRFSHPETRELYGTIDARQTLEVGVGETVRVAAFTQHGKKRVYPRARFAVEQGHRYVDVELLGRDDASGTILVRGVRPGTAVLSYRLLTEQERFDPRERTGQLRVIVRDGFRYDDVAQDPYTGTSEQRAWHLVDSLYRGILLRRPEDSQPQRVRDIRDGGWEGARRVALDIAYSQESRELASEVDAEQRLAALYRNLLGVDPSRVSRDEWGRNLEQVRYGRLGNVVAELVERQDFAIRFGLDTRYVMPRR